MTARSRTAGASAQQLRRRNHELSVLNAIAEGLNRAVDLKEALGSALALVAELLGLRAGWVWLLDPETGEPELAAAQHLPPVLQDEPNRMTGMCYCLRTFLRGDMEGAANVNVVECSRLWGLVEGTEGLNHHASIPLYAGAERLGVMNVATDDWRELTAEELRLLYTIGYQIGIAVERARLHARAAETATVEERLRLARELHDSLAQLLSAITLQLETANALVERSPEQVQQKIQEALQLAREALQETRAVVHDLRAGPLASKRLPQALRELGARYAGMYGLKVQVSSSGPSGRLPAQLETNLFRVAQEALTNIVKHADARRAWVNLLVGPESVTLLVRDNGRGFDPELAPGGAHGEARAREGYGLSGINERVRLHGGALGIETVPGKGTRLKVTVPLAGAGV